MPTAPTHEQRAATRVRPARSPVMFQTWSNLLFLHWAWDASAVQATLPEGLYVDKHADRAYLGVVPFWMDAVRPRFCPPVPGLSWFLELNLRTYVHTADGTPGVWFYSLDCNNPIAVHLARSLFSLPYVHARQTGVRPTSHPQGFAKFTSCRQPPASALNQFIYTGTTAPTTAPHGTLEYFLAERYLLFSRSRRSGHLYAGRVWHHPYLLSPAHVEQAETSLFTDNDFPDPVRPADHAMISPRVDVSIYGLQRLPA